VQAQGFKKLAPTMEAYLKTLRGLEGTVLYLDFDGVLHHEDVWWLPRRGAYIRPPGFKLFALGQLKSCRSYFSSSTKVQGSLR